MNHFVHFFKAMLCLVFACASLTLKAATPTEYDVTVKINIEQGDAGVCFASPDDDNFVMFQIKSGAQLLRPHAKVNGDWKNVFDIHFPDGFSLENNKDYTVRISVTDNGEKAAVFIAPEGGAETKLGEVDKASNSDYNFQYARLGIRQDHDGDIVDKAYFDDFRITSGSEVLYSEDFSDAANCSFSFGDTYSIVGGRLLAQGSKDGETRAWQVIKADESNNFKVECDFEINGVAAGIIWNATDESNFYMWQFNVERNPSQFRPHVWTSNGVSAKDINVEIVANHMYHLLIDVVNGGKKAITYLDGKMIDEREGNFVPEGKLGIRASYAAHDVDGVRPPEDAYYDNFRITANNDDVIFEEDFSNTSAVYFSEGMIDNGRLHIVGPSEGETRVWQTETPNNFTSSITSVAGDDCGKVTVYNILGIPVLQNADAARMSELPSGLYIVNGKKIIIR